jgi:hypothetical protein
MKKSVQKKNESVSVIDSKQVTTPDTAKTKEMPIEGLIFCILFFHAIIFCSYKLKRHLPSIWKGLLWFSAFLSFIFNAGAIEGYTHGGALVCIPISLLTSFGLALYLVKKSKNEIPSIQNPKTSIEYPKTIPTVEEINAKTAGENMVLFLVITGMVICTIAGGF